MFPSLKLLSINKLIKDKIKYDKDELPSELLSIIDDFTFMINYWKDYSRGIDLLNYLRQYRDYNNGQENFDKLFKTACSNKKYDYISYVFDEITDHEVKLDVIRKIILMDNVYYFTKLYKSNSKLDENATIISLFKYAIRKAKFNIARLLSESLSDETITQAITKVELELLVKFNIGMLLEHIALTPTQIKSAMYMAAKHKNLSSLIYLRDRKHADISYLAKYITSLILNNNMEFVRYLYDNKFITRQYPNLLNEMLNSSYLLNLNNLDYLYDNNIVPKKITPKTMYLIVNKYFYNQTELVKVIEYLQTKIPEQADFIEKKYNKLVCNKKDRNIVSI